MGTVAFGCSLLLLMSRTGSWGADGPEVDMLALAMSFATEGAIAAGLAEGI